MRYSEILSNKLNKVIKDIEYANKQIKDINDELVILKETNNLINEIMFIKKNETLVIEEVVNEGLKYIYPKKQLKFSIKFEEKNNKVIPEFYINDKILKPPFTGHFGGVINITSILIYVVYIKLKGKQIILLDEAESMVDINATNKLFEFLNYFSIQNNLSISVVTQKSVKQDVEMVTDKIGLIKY